MTEETSLCNGRTQSGDNQTTGDKLSIYLISSDVRVYEGCMVPIKLSRVHAKIVTQCTYLTKKNFFNLFCILCSDVEDN